MERPARCVALFALVMALAACASDNKPDVDPNVFPAAYKQEILNTLMQVLDDPTNVRNASISDPVLRPASRDPRYSVCIRADSRNANHNYMGSKDRIAYFYGGHLNQLVEATKEQCGNAAYKPFPELEKLCQAEKCS
jgi:hypothetical protein